MHQKLMKEQKNGCSREKKSFFLKKEGGQREEEEKGVIRFSHDGGCMRENVVTLHELLPF